MTNQVTKPSNATLKQLSNFWHISKLQGWDKNPRGITEAGLNRLKKQIKDLGQYKPLLITPDGVVLGGNMRLQAYEQMDITNIWVSIVHPKTEAEKLAYALSDNDRVGYYDEDLLAGLYTELPNFKWADFSVDLDEPTKLGDLITQFDPTIIDDIGLPDGEKEGFEQITFTLTNAQAEVVREATSKAKADGASDSANENSNGNAIAHVCLKYNAG